MFLPFSDKEKVNVSSQIDGPVNGCPNTVNPYHTCVEYCGKRYGENAPPQPPKVSYIISYEKVIVKVLLFSVVCSISYETAIIGRRQCALPPPSVSAPFYGYLKL